MTSGALSAHEKDMPRRLFATVSISLLVGSLCYWYQVTNSREGGDISWPLCAARMLVQGGDPYTCSAGANMPTNMLPVALFVFPLIVLDRSLAASGVIGLSTALLVWGLLRQGEHWRLMLLLSFPFWQCVQVANWTILLVAVAFSPRWYPLLLVKPHAAIPVGFARFSWPGVALGGVIAIVSFLLLPDWPLRWWATATTYSGGPLILQFSPAVLTFLALLRWRSEAARYLVLCALAPLRAFYDYLLLFVLPQTPRQLITLVIGSWIAYFGWFFMPAIDAAMPIFIFLYLPCLVWVLRERVQQIHPTTNPEQGDAFSQLVSWYSRSRGA
jgi:hypothetical protein